MKGQEISRSPGERLLTIVERIVDDTDLLIGRVEAVKRLAREVDGLSDIERRRWAADRIIAGYSNRSALAGGLSAAVAILPGLGTALALVGGTLADLGLTLKYEVEMSLSLAYLFGHDIRETRARQMAYVLASVNTYEARSGRTYFADPTGIEIEALWRRTPRQAGKLLLSAMSRLALTRASKGLLRALPVIGVVASASANKLLTTSVGKRCLDVLAVRPGTIVEVEDETSVVDARVEE